jgi:hypothetical protein
MSKRVTKHCSILNYIRHADSDLYELIQDLCIGRMLVPRRNTPGLTFLRPDKALLSKIQSMASGDNPEEAVRVLQSMVLLDNLPTPGDFDDKKDDIPTFLRKKLGVVSVDGKKVNLKNGGECVVDKDFAARNDRGTISVYVLSKELIPTDGEESQFANAKKATRKVKGGAEYQQNKRALFESILKRHCNKEFMDAGNPAMEVLTSLCDYLKTEGKTEEYNSVVTHLSNDTLGSLAIVLQAYRPSDDNMTYVKQDVFSTWAARSNNTSAGYSSIFYYQDDVLDKYHSHMEAGKTLCAGLESNFKKVQLMTASTSAKVNIVGKLAGAYQDIARGLAGVNAVRGAVLSNRKLALAESELRVFSALLHDEARDCIDWNEASKLYSDKCNLIQPYIVADKDQIAMSNMRFYYSSTYLIARSCALCYWPGHSGSSLDEIANEDEMICLDSSLDLKKWTGAYEARNKELAKLRAVLGVAPK